MWVLEPFRFADACAERACYDAIPMSDAQEKPNRPRGHRIALDLLAKSASRTQPAFVAKPEGAPLYHGFPILSIVVEGFTFGKISDFDAEPCTEGDAFAVAPDNSRAGLVWEVSGNSYFREVSSNRWGVWAVSFPHPMTNHENVQLHCGDGCGIPSWSGPRVSPCVSQQCFHTVWIVHQGLR